MCCLCVAWSGALALDVLQELVDDQVYSVTFEMYVLGSPGLVRGRFATPRLRYTAACVHGHAQFSAVRLTTP